MNKQSRQLLNFLRKQNQMLKDDIKQLNQVLKLNRQALRVSLMQKNQQNFQTFVPPLIKLLYEQNNKLHSTINQLKAQIESGMCQALISDQIAFASTQQQVLLTNQLKQKLHKMRKQLQSRQIKIVQLQKMNTQQKTQNNNIVNSNIERIKLIQYSDMNKVSKKLKDSIDKLNQQLDEKKQEVQKLKDVKEELFKLNLILTKQLNQMKIVYSCQTTKSNNQISVQFSNNDLGKYLKYQKKLINQGQNIYEDERKSSQINSSNQSDESQSSEIDEFPSEQECNENQNSTVIQKQESKANQSMQTMQLNLKLKPPKQINMTLNLGSLGGKKGVQQISKGEQKIARMNIPKLELTKAKQIQNLIVKKINNDEKKKKQGTNPVIKDEKYRKLEDELQNLRKKMGNEILQKLAIEREGIFLKKIIIELQERNCMLVERKVLEQQEQNYEKIRKDHESLNTQTLLDICRDVTLNQRLRRIVLGKQKLQKKIQIQSFQI